MPLKRMKRAGGERSDRSQRENCSTSNAPSITLYVKAADSGTPVQTESLRMCNCVANPVSCLFVVVVAAVVSCLLIAAHDGNCAGSRSESSTEKSVRDNGETM